MGRCWRVPPMRCSTRRDTSTSRTWDVGISVGRISVQKGSFSPTSDKERMKITDVRWTPAFIPIEAPLRYAFGSHPGFSRIIIEVHTDEGIVGLGECYGGASREG